MCQKERFLAIALTAGILAFYGCAKKEKRESVGTYRETKVKTTVVKRGNIEEVISLTGDIHGQKEINVYTKVPGKLSEKVKQAGERVKEGEVIALIDRNEESLKYSKAEIKSPINGFLTMYFAELGADVFPSQPMPREPVAMVADIDEVKVLVYISERDMGKVKKGQTTKISIDAYPDRVFKGLVNEVALAANPATRKLKVEINLSNLGRLLKLGTFARVEIITAGHNNILIVPRNAVLERDEEKVVFTCENAQAKMVKVLTGAEDEKNIEIKEGLKEGEEIITEGNYGLIEGAKVEVTR